MVAKSFLIALSLLSVACAVPNSQRAAVTPQRPTFSRNTQTTAFKTLELESGVTYDHNDSVTSPMTLKYGIDEDEEIFLSVSPLNVISLPGNDGEGFGDLTVGVARRVWTDGRTAAAYQLSTKLPTGNENQGLSNGEIDFFGAAVVDHQIDLATTLTAFYQLGVIGDAVGNDPGIQHGFALAGSHTLNDEYGLFAELAGYADPGRIDPVFATMGATYTLNRYMVADAAVVLGVNSDAPDAQFLIGITTNFGALTRPTDGP